MNITRNGITIEVPDAQVVDLVLERLQAGEIDWRTTRLSETTPKIGEPWPGQGGIYAGIMRGRDGNPDYHLIVGKATEPMPWGKAKDEVERHPEWSLPYRAEQALCYANVPELFEKEWYWSCEQHAGTAGYAWCQNFGNGNQYYNLKSNELRARAVRRLVIR